MVKPGKEGDLSGRWAGVYVYPDDDYPPTPFTAELVDDGGVLTGWTQEPDLLDGGPDIHATLEGQHAGSAVVFTKFPAGGQLHTIDYQGDVAADGRQIIGRWIIYGEWSGAFRMQRRLAPTETALERAASA